MESMTRKRARKTTFARDAGRFVWPVLAACLVLACSGKISHPPSDGPDGMDGSMEDGGADGGDIPPAESTGRCSSDEDCPPGTTCQQDTGLCIDRSCLTDGCPAGQYCDPAALECRSEAPGDHPLYVGQTIVGHNVQQRLGTRDSAGIQGLGNYKFLAVTRDGRYIYAVENEIVRVDQATMRVETIAGLGWPGYRDGPGDVAQLETNTYQAGGIGLTPDGRYLYFTANNRVRRLDLRQMILETVWPSDGSTDNGLRGLAVGRSGNVYFNGWSGFYVLHPDGGVEQRNIDASQAWSGNGGNPPGFIGVDEERGWVYGLERNLKSGAFYRWPVQGGQAEWLNHLSTGSRDPEQYLSDGPVERMEMANPSGLFVDKDGYVYMGAGDGRTFRRYNPDAMTVESLCWAEGYDRSANTFEWCIGDGERNKIFGTWPSFIVFDDAGNGYFGWSVWPRLVRLRRVQAP